MSQAWEITAVALAIAYLVLAIRQSLWCWPAAIASTGIYVGLMYQASLYMESALQFFYIAMALYGWWAWSRGETSTTGVAVAGEFAQAASRDDAPPADLGHRPGSPATATADRGGFDASPKAAPSAFRHPPDGSGDAPSQDRRVEAPARRSAGQRQPLAVSAWPARAHLIAVVTVLLLAAASGWLLTRYTSAALPYADAFTTWGAIVTTYMTARKILENWLYWFVIDSVSVYLYVSRGLYLTAALFLVYLVLIVIGYRAWRRSMEQGVPRAASPG